jgi:hypothetical protein
MLVQPTLHFNRKESIVKRSYKLAAAIAAALGLGVAGAAFAHSDGMGHEGMGPGMIHGGMGSGGMGGGAMHGGPMAGQQLMTPEERAALQEKMRNAKTPEERQKIAEATHAEMQKRAKEKGITAPERHSPGADFAPHSTPPAQSR